MKGIAVILAAAGGSTRFNHPVEKKPFIKLGSKAVWLHSAERLLRRPEVKQLIVVIAPGDRDEFLARFGPNVAVLGLDVVEGGNQRSDSVQRGLEKVSADCDWVLVHDAARPCWEDGILDRLIEAAGQHAAIIPTIPVASTLKRSADGKQVQETVDRSGLYQAQTPQLFQRSVLEQGFAQRGESQPTDESQMLEQQGHPIAMVAGSPLNIKLTRRADLALAKACLEALPKPRFDARPHPFSDDTLFR